MNIPGGISFQGALFLLLLTMKLTGEIDWSWWVVTVPLWWVFGWTFIMSIPSQHKKGERR
jgi:hypothetical protein